MYEYEHRYPGHRCLGPHPWRVYARNGGLTITEAMAVVAEVTAECEARCAAYDAAKAEEGTSRRSLAQIAKTVGDGNTLNTHERAAVRRALNLGKPVPQHLVEALDAPAKGAAG